MAKIDRVLQKIFGTDGGLSEFGQIGSDFTLTPLKTKDLTLIQGLQAFRDGLFALTQAASQPPRTEDLNSLYYLLTKQLAYIFEAGIPEWESGTDYFNFTSFVQVAGDVYLAIQDSINKNPTSEPAYWRKVLPKEGFDPNLFLKKSNNLNDLSSFSTARTNLDVFSKSEIEGKFKYSILNVSSNLTLTGNESSQLLLNCIPNTIAQYGIININLPDAGSYPGNRYFIYHDHTNRGIIKINATSEISYKGKKYTSFKIYDQGSFVKIFSNGQDWVIEKCYTEIRTNSINRSDFTNVLIGNAIQVDTRGGTGTTNLEGQVVTGTNGSFLCVYDGGTFLAFHGMTGVGTLLDNELLTSSDGTTLLVNEVTSTLNKDRNFWHNTGLLPLSYELDFNLFFASSVDLFIPYSVSSVGSNIGANYKSFDTVSFQFRTGSNGVTYRIDDTGSATIIATPNIFCELRMIIRV